MCGSSLGIFMLMLVSGVQLAFGDHHCPAGAKPFPSDISGEGNVGSAQLFTISYHDTYKVIKYNPTLVQYKVQWPVAWQRGKAVDDIVLYQCGTDPPTPSAVNGISVNASFYSIPVQTVALGWTGTLAFMELLSLTEPISAIDMSYISSPCTQLLAECDAEIATATNRGDTWHTATNDVNFTLTDTWGTGYSEHGRNVPFEMSTDPGLLDRASWIFFTAAFFNEEAAAADIYGRIEADYNRMKAHAAELKAAATTTPVVAWVTQSDWVQLSNGTWCNTCGGVFRITSSHFKQEVVQDAGGQLLTLPSPPGDGCEVKQNSDGSQTYECTMAGKSNLQQLLNAADVIIDETFAANYAGYTLDSFINIFGLSAPSSSAMVNEAIYRIEGTISDPYGDSGTVGSAWFEAMPAQPQVLLSDVLEAIWGDASGSQCSMTYLRHLHSNAEQDIQEHSDCPYYDAGGSHDCDAIHDHEHTVHICTPETETAAGALRFGPAMSCMAFIVALMALAM